MSTARMSSSAVSCELEPGTLLSGKYRVGRLIGAGGFGRVYEAEDLTLGIEVALKVGREGRCDERARREARMAAQLRSPHSVRVYDVDWLHDGTPCIVMELLKGESLRDHMKRQEKVDVVQAVRWMLQLCSALEEAHGYGLVHRDIKPGNLIVVPQGNEAVLKLVDFGLAKSLAPETEESLTESGILVGSPAYMSPEQVRGTGVGAESDIWALGVVLYELLSGRRPFDGASSSAILAAIVADPPTPLHEVAPECPPRLHAIVERCLRKAPADRFRSVRQLGGELRAALAGWQGVAPPALDASEDASATLSHILPASSDFRESTAARRRKSKARLATAAVVLLGATGLWWLVKSGPSPELAETLPSSGRVLPVEVRAPPAPPPAGRQRSLPTPDRPQRAEPTPAPLRVERAKVHPPEPAASARTKPGMSSPPAPASAPYLFEEPDF